MINAKKQSIKELQKLIKNTDSNSKGYEFICLVLTLIERKRPDQALATVTSLDKEIIDLFPEVVLRYLRYL
mgnify:CR=1 FL=1|jgi:hypothetical protein